EGGAHVLHPDRQGRLGAELAATERTVVVEADPNRGGKVGVEAHEPGIAMVVGGTGFAGQVVAAQGARRGAGAAHDHILHQRGDQVIVAYVDDVRREHRRMLAGSVDIGRKYRTAG